MIKNDSFFSDEYGARFLSAPVKAEVKERVREVLARHRISNPELEADLIDMTNRGIAYHRDALKTAVATLEDVRRYRNMKAFPVVVSLVQKVANQASRAMGYRIPFPDHYSEHDDSPEG